MKLLFTFLLTSSFFFSTAQTYTWQRMYGNDHQLETAADVIQLPDGDYVFVGATSTSSDSSQILLCKTDRVGNPKWQHLLGTTGHSIGHDLAIIPNEGLILAGAITDTLGYSDMYIAKVDFSGDLLWERTYGDALNDVAFSIQPTADGGFIMSGYKETEVEGEELVLLKIDNNGAVQWQNQYGGVMNERGYEVIVTSDGGYAVTGFTESFGNGMKDLFLIKTDFVGNEMWIQTYGNTNNQVGHSLVQNSQGGFVITGKNEFSSYYPEDLYIMGTDANGVEIWSNSYGGDARVQGLSISPVAEGGYVIAGSRSTFFGFYPSDFYVFRINEEGIKLWDRDYTNDFPAVAHSITVTQDGGFIIAGLAQPSADETTQDAQLIKTDALGNIDKTFKANVENNSPLACFGDENGQVDVWVTGGQYPYTYDWALLATDTFNVTQLRAAQYELTITDANGEQLIQQSTIITPDSLSLAPEMMSSTTCPESLDGIAQVVARGGTAPYGYLWDNGTATSTDSTLVAGTYRVTVVDANACQATTEVVVTSTSSIAVDIVEQNNASCTGANDGRLAVMVTGGNPPFSYQLNDEIIAETALENLTIGDYTLYIRDANGCRVTREFTIDAAAEVAPNASFTNQITDLSVSFTAQLTAADSVQWDFGNGIFSSETNPIYAYPAGGDYTVCLNAFNACGRTTVCNSISLLDCSTVDIDTDFEASNTDTLVQFTNISTGEIDSYRWRFGDGSSSRAENPSHTYATPGNYEVCLTSRSRCGNFTFCDSVVVNLNSNILIDVAGVIEMIDGQLMEDVIVNCGALADTTTFAGDYSLQTNARSNCVIMPRKEDRHNNGVSTFDILLTRKHILNLEPFTSPYQFIAADVNDSGTVTSFDMIFMQRLILTLIDEFPNVPSWRFVPKDYEFPDGSFQGFPESIALNDISASRSDLDFVGVKMGDLNNSAVPNFTGQVEERKTITEFLTIDNQSFVAGEIITVPVRLNVEASGFQFALHIEDNDLEILHIETAPLTNLNDQNFYIHKEKVATVWWADGAHAKAGEVLFNLKLRARHAGQIKKSIRLMNDQIKGEVYDANLNTADLAIQFEQPTPSAALQISPNPAHDILQIQWANTTTNHVQFQLIHASGKVIKTWQSDGYKKSNPLKINHLQSGVYFIQMNNNGQKLVQKFIKY